MTAARAWSCASRTSWVVTVAQTDYIQPLAVGMTGDDSVDKPLRFQTCTHTRYACDNWQLRGTHGFNLGRLPNSSSLQDSPNRLTILDISTRRVTLESLIRLTLLAISTLSRRNRSASDQNSLVRLTLLAISTNVQT